MSDLSESHSWVKLCVGIPWNARPQCAAICATSFYVISALTLFDRPNDWSELGYNVCLAVGQGRAKDWSSRKTLSVVNVKRLVNGSMVIVKTLRTVYK